MKLRYTIDDPELSPDLDWMLESRQVSTALLLEKLLDEHYSRIFHLAYSFLNDQNSAYQACKRIFTKAIARVHTYRSNLGVDAWLDAIAWREILRARRRGELIRNFGRIGFSADHADHIERFRPEDEFWSIINKQLDRSSIEDRWAFIARYLHGWQIERIQRASGRTESSIRNGIRKILRSIEGNLDSARIATNDLGSRITQMLERRWPEQTSSNGDFKRILKETEIATDRVNTWRKPVSMFWEFSIFAFVGISIIGLLWWFNKSDGPASFQSAQTIPITVTPAAAGVGRSDSADDLDSQHRLSPPAYIPLTPSPTPTPNGIFYIAPSGWSYEWIADSLGVPVDELRRLNRIPEDQKIYSGEKLLIPGNGPSVPVRYATPIAPATHTLPLEPPDDNDGTLSYIYPSEVTFHTLWFDAYILQYERISRDRIHRIHHIQLWLSEDQALILGGPVDETPAEVMLWTNGNYYSAKPGEDNPWFTEFHPGSRSPIIDLRLIFGAAILLKQAGISIDSDFKYIREGSIAGRDTLVLSEIYEDDRVQALVNVDKETGFILRYQRLMDYPIEENLSRELPDEVRVNAVMYDIDFPQGLFNPRFPWRGGYAADYTGTPIRLGE